MNSWSKSLSSSHSQAACRQDQPCSLVHALFSVGFFQQRFGYYCPTSTWWTCSGTHSTGKHSFSWQSATPVRQAAIVTAAWQSMLHAHSPTCTPAFILSALPPLSLPLCVFPLCSALSQLPREGSDEMREGQKSESSLQNLPFSVSHSLDSLRHPSSSCCFARVSGKSWLCLRGVPAPSAKTIDPLITCYSTSLRKERVCTCTIYTPTPEHILTEKSAALKHNRVLTKVLFLTSCQTHLLFFSIVMSLSPL